MKKNQPAAGESQAKMKVIEIESLDMLQEIVNAPVHVECKFNGQAVRLACRRLTPAIDEQVRAIRRSAQPPWSAERKDYDYTNPKYLEQMAVNEKKARALIIYTGCPAVAAKSPGLVNPNDIHNFVRSILTENLLELIALTIVGGGMEVVERTNFTSTSPSES